MRPAELLAAMAAQVRDGEAWAGIDPAPVFDPAAAPDPRATAVSDPVASPAAVRAGGVAAADIVERVLDEAEGLGARLNVFTSVFAEAARADAAAVDEAVRAGRDPGPLAGVPVAVKDLFDVQGVVTLAGSIALADRPPAREDATAVARLRRAGAVVVGATNMDEFAYGFTTENSHYGSTRNPHDPDRVAGGSSGGSAAAVASGLAVAALGTDTNGSVRIPAAFCGVFGLRPTYGLVPRTGSLLFAPSFDAVGPLAATVADLAVVADVIAGPDGLDPVALAPRRPLTSFLAADVSELVFAVAGGELWDGALPEVHSAALHVARALGADRTLELPDVQRARAAAIVITAAEGADQHQRLLREQPELLDPRVRDRFLAGLGVPAIDYLSAQRFRRSWQPRVLSALAGVDVLVLPTVGFPAPLHDQVMIELNGAVVPTGAVLGRFTQPLSFVGLPALSVPVVGAGGLPIGIQLAARPGADGLLVAAAAQLERLGIAVAARPETAVQHR